MRYFSLDAIFSRVRAMSEWSLSSCTLVVVSASSIPVRYECICSKWVRQSRLSTLTVTFSCGATFSTSIRHSSASVVDSIISSGRCAEVAAAAAAATAGPALRSVGKRS